jgi:hypothetical protein
MSAWVLSTAVHGVPRVVLLVVATAVVLIWLDAIRNLARAWQIYFSHYRVLSPATRPRVSLWSSQRSFRFSNILDDPMAGALPTAAAGYRRAMLRFFIEGGVGGAAIGIAVLAVLLS